MIFLPKLSLGTRKNEKKALSELFTLYLHF
jgi:hypothetical protein